MSKRRPKGCIYQRPDSSVWWIKYSLNGKSFRESTHSENRYLSKSVNSFFCPFARRFTGYHKDFTRLFQRRPQRAASVVWRAQPDICSRHKRLRLSSNGKQCESI